MDRCDNCKIDRAKAGAVKFSDGFNYSARHRDTGHGWICFDHVPCMDRAAAKYTGLHGRRST